MKLLSINLLYVLLLCSVFAKNVEKQSSIDTFQSAFEHIMKRSTTIPVQQALLRARKTDKLSGYSLFLPTINLIHTRAKTHKINSDRNQYQLQGSWNLFNSGADIANAKASNYDLEAQEGQVKLTSLEMEATALQALLSTIRMHKQTQILQKFKDIKVKSLRTTKQRFNKGLSPRVEVDKVLIDVEIADARLKDALISQEIILSNLQVLFGEEKTHLQSWPWNQKMIKKSHALEKMNMNVEQRPEFKYLENKFLSSKQSEKSRFRQLFLRVDLNTSYGFTEVRQNDRLYEFSSLLTFSIPLFEGFKQYSAYKSGQAIKVSDEYRFLDFKRKAKAQTTFSKSQYKISLQTALRRDRNLSLARKLYRQNFKRFRKGRSTVNDLLLDQSRLLESENLALEGWLAAHQKFYQYCHNLGHSINKCL